MRTKPIVLLAALALADHASAQECNPDFDLVFEAWLPWDTVFSPHNELGRLRRAPLDSGARLVFAPGAQGFFDQTDLLALGEGVERATGFDLLDNPGAAEIRVMVLPPAKYGELLQEGVVVYSLTHDAASCVSDIEADAATGALSTSLVFFSADLPQDQRIGCLTEHVLASLGFRGTRPSYPNAPPLPDAKDLALLAGLYDPRVGTSDLLQGRTEPTSAALKEAWCRFVGPSLETAEGDEG